MQVPICYVLHGYTFLYFGRQYPTPSFSKSPTSKGSFSFIITTILLNTCKISSSAAGSQRMVITWRRALILPDHTPPVATPMPIILRIMEVIFFFSENLLVGDNSSAHINSRFL